jgi:hypothetical protein
MKETGIHKARNLKSSEITRKQCFIKVLQPGALLNHQSFTKWKKRLHILGTDSGTEGAIIS